MRTRWWSTINTPSACSPQLTRSWRACTPLSVCPRKPRFSGELLALFLKAGDEHSRQEEYELLAHASVQSGDLSRARDLYQRLAPWSLRTPCTWRTTSRCSTARRNYRGCKASSCGEAAVVGTSWRPLLLPFTSTIPMKSRWLSAPRSPTPNSLSPTNSC